MLCHDQINCRPKSDVNKAGCLPSQEQQQQLERGDSTKLSGEVRSVRQQHVDRACNYSERLKPISHLASVSPTERRLVQRQGRRGDATRANFQPTFLPSLAEVNTQVFFLLQIAHATKGHHHESSIMRACVRAITPYVSSELRTRPF